MSCEFTHPHQCGGHCAGCTSAHTAPAVATPASQVAAARQPGGYPWDAITPVNGAYEDELEADLADAALGLLMTLILVSATAFAAGFVFARLFG